MFGQSKPVLVIAAVAAAAVAVNPAHSQANGQQHHAGHHAAQVVEVTGEDYAFRVPAEIPSGWTTFRFDNAGEETHMLFIARLPDGRTFDDYVTEVVVPFSDVWYDLRDGALDPEEVFPVLIGSLGPWFWETEFYGGVSLLAPGGEAEATVNLPPGTYVIECYMRSPDGEMHSMEGMIDPVIVTDAGPAGSAPHGDVRVKLSIDGMDIQGQVRPGTQTFEVEFLDHPEGTFGHDFTIIRVDERTTVEQVKEWLDLTRVEALTDPAPGTFVGGLNPLPAGSTGYFTTELEPGRYFFLSEFTAPMGVWQEVIVGR